ncbi:MAG: hypothetical protein HXL14_06540 [Parvimonas sp.]|nr:hypothetical protein [Parvimonas sp.]
MDILKIGGYASAICAILLLAKNIYEGVVVINNLNSTVISLNQEVVDLKINVEKTQKEISEFKKSFSELKIKLNELNKAFKQMKLEDEKQSNSIRSILRQLIINYTNDILDRQYIYNEEIYCLRQLYEGYALLGGNCTIEERVKEVIKLPAKAGLFNPNKQMIDKAIEEIKKIIQNNKGE